MSISSGKVNITDLNKSLQHFDWPDYAVFILMLAGSAVIGIYFGFVENKSKSVRSDRQASDGSDRQASDAAQEYLMGGGRLSLIPVACSLVASWVSGIFLLGSATEIYMYGTSQVFLVVSLLVAAVVIRFIFLPVFYNLRLTSTYEYLEMRFDKRVRLFGSILYTIATIAYLPVVIYVPALAFNQVTGVNIHVVSPFVCAVCMFYTLVGGIKAVVWTDCVQMILMFLSMALIIVKGTIDVSGLQTVWDRNYDGGRLNFPEFTFDLTERHSVLSLLIGGVPLFIYFSSMNQSMLQRYTSLPTIKDANRALYIFVVLLSTFILICCYNGLLTYAWYAGCDPVKTKLIGKPDQLLPLLSMNILGDYPGMPGLFIAGIFSAALSTLSTSLNSMAAIVLEDFVKPFLKAPLSEQHTRRVMQATVFFIGILAVTLIFVVQRLGTVLQLTMTLDSLTAGPLFGLFVMGFMCPWVKRRGALIGTITGLVVMIWILVYAQHDIATGDIKFAVKPSSIDECNYAFETVSQATNSTIQHNKGSAFRIHHMSYLFYTIFGGTISIIVGSLTSLICKDEFEKVLNPMLFAPFVRKFLNFKEVDTMISVTHSFDIVDTQA